MCDGTFVTPTIRYSLLAIRPLIPRMTQPDDHEPTEAERRRTNLMLLAVAVVVVVLGVYLVNWMIDQRKLQECLQSGRRNCAPITTPSR
jgi:hypothetical protein